MLADSPVATRLPVKDLERTRRFYSEKLGLQPVEERPGGLCYRCGGGYFALFESTGTASGDHTQMGWEVANIETTVATLRACGVVFEDPHVEFLYRLIPSSPLVTFTVGDMWTVSANWLFFWRTQLDDGLYGVQTTAEVDRTCASILRSSSERSSWYSPSV
jgi:catechol 2,3-dioxygenase-like lactoylglutathione lyase family enzyme